MTGGGAVGGSIAIHAGRSRVLFPMGTWGLLIDLILTVGLWPWGRLSV